MIALDYTARIKPAALRAADVSDVCRYLSWTYYWGGVTHSYPNPKIIQLSEYRELLGAGIGVTLNWEYDAKDWLGGARAGTEHAAEAVKQARALGYPAGATIIGSADFDMTRGQWDSAGRAYAQAFAAGIKEGGYTSGVYGPYDVLTWCSQETGMRAFWQAGMSWAWSAGRNRNRWPGAHLRQMAHKTVDGRDTDWNEILIPKWGQARKEPDDDMSARAEESIEYMAWRLEALMFGRDQINGGPDAGQEVPLVKTVNTLAALAKTNADTLARIETALRTIPASASLPLGGSAAVNALFQELGARIATPVEYDQPGDHAAVDHTADVPAPASEQG